MIRVQLGLEASGSPSPRSGRCNAGSCGPTCRPPRRDDRPKANLARATEPHETWQMDAKEHIRMKNREEVSWLRMIDECSGAVLWTVVFPPRDLGSRSPPKPCGTRSAWPSSLWGLPGRFRVDNGWPWGSSGDFPTELSLWLIGLGIAMHWNNAGRPQENGVVERSQGTSDRWCEPWTCRTPAELQGRLERMDRLYREVYPYRKRLSRMDVFPGLEYSGRPYDREFGADAVGVVARRRALGGHRAAAAGRSEWPSFGVQPQPLCGPAPSRKGCLCDVRSRPQRVDVRRSRRPTTEPSASGSAQSGASHGVERKPTPMVTV